MTKDLLDKVELNPSSNVVVIPVLQVLQVLIEGDALLRLADDEDGVNW
jgi:hypothetical protein